MIFLKISIIGLCFAILGNGVTGNNCGTNPTRYETFTSPFYFTYIFEELHVNVIIKLKNASRRITSIWTTFVTDVPVSKYRFRWPEGDQYMICDLQNFKKVSIGLELYSLDGLCAIREVSKGRHVSLLHGRDVSTYKSFPACANIGDSACVIEVDLRNDCLERKSNPNANRNISYVTLKPEMLHTARPTQDTLGTTRHTSFTTKPTISNTARRPHNSSNTHRNTSLTSTHNIPDAYDYTTSVTSDTPEASQNQSNTSNTVEFTINERKSNPNANRNKSYVTLKPEMLHTARPTQDTLGTTRHTSFTTKPTISNTARRPHNSSNTHRNTSLTSTHNIPDAYEYTTSVTSDTPEASQNQSNTSNTVEFTINDADIKKYITATVASGISVIALIVLVVVLRKCCWINPVDLSQLPTNDQSSPFYLNLLFRKECDQEIELIEQHHYEEINPQ